MAIKIMRLFTSTKAIYLSLSIGLMIGVIGCGPVANRSSTSNTNEQAYPVQTEPAPEQIEAYPVPTLQNGILLSFTKPISVNDNEVHGVGPAGLPIVIQNITLMGEQMGSGIIDEDGTFSIPITLQSNIRIGLNADIESFGLSPEDIQLGSDAMTVPLVGFFYDTARIQE